MKLLFFVTEDWYFCSHRLALAVAARRAGYDVAVVTRVRAHGERILAAGIRLIPIELARRGLNPLEELRVILRLRSIYAAERPDIIHHVAMKPVVHGSIAAQLSGRRGAIVNGLAGLGWIFIASGLKAAVVRALVANVLRFLLRRSTVIVQNGDDREFVVRLGVPPARVASIPGSGVDTDAFVLRPEPAGIPVVVLASRLLWDKGVGEFVSAARALRAQGTQARFVLVGNPDPGNPAAIPARQLDEWLAEGCVESWGWREDMPAVLAQCHVACLPSYREGLPKSLLEAASAGLPIVTTDVPGCRDVVTDGVNGILVPPRNVELLARALRQLIDDRRLRMQMGARGRELVLERFALPRIVDATLALYERVRAA